MENVLETGTEVFYDGDEKLVIRRLSVMDVFKFAKLLAKVGTEAMGQISELTSGSDDIDEDGKKEQAQQVGFYLFATLSEYEVELLDFLAGLTNKTLPEFKQLPPEVAIDVITTLVEGDDLKRFFEKARALATKFQPKVAPQN